MLDIARFEQELQAGSAPPIALCIAGTEVTWQFRHQRRDGQLTTLVYGLSDWPLTLQLQVDRQADDLLSFRAWLLAEQAIREPISDLRLLDRDFDGVQNLRRFNGGCNWLQQGDAFPHHNFQIHDHSIDVDTRIDWREDEGRCSLQFLPVWWLQGDGQGLWFGPEWAGSWQLRQDGPRLRFGLPHCHFVLQQGEQVPLPAMTLGSYQGDVWAGCLHLRRCLRDHLLPDLGGQPIQPPVFYQYLGGAAAKLDAAGLQRETAIAEELGIEAFVWASPWNRSVVGSTVFEDQHEMFPDLCRPDQPDSWGNWWENTGEHIPAADRFPAGIERFSTDLKQRGMVHGLWYDPRVSEYTEEATRTHDLTLPFTPRPNEKQAKAYSMRLIDLGRTDAQRYQVAELRKFIEDFGAEWIWHDLNVEIRERYFDRAEAPDRRGLMELRYHAGIEVVYDEIRRRFPQVRIEWCASGGNMINLGILRRCHALWVTDHDRPEFTDTGDAHSDVLRVFRTFLNWIMPAGLIMNSPSYFAEVQGCAFSEHDLVMQMGSAFGFAQYLMDWNDDNQAAAKQAVAVFKRIRQLLHRDFWGLFPQQVDRSGWDGWQYHDPETGDGVLLLFRGSQCQQEQQVIQPRWLGQVQTEVLFGQAEVDPVSWTIRMPGTAAVVAYRGA